MPYRSCFVCGADPESAELHVVALNQRGLTACFRESCQRGALDALRQYPPSELVDFTLLLSWRDSRENKDRNPMFPGSHSSSPEGAA